MLTKKQLKLSSAKSEAKGGVMDAGEPGHGVGFPLPEEAKMITTADAVKQALGHGGVDKCLLQPTAAPALPQAKLPCLWTTASKCPTTYR